MSQADRDEWLTLAADAVDQAPEGLFIEAWKSARRVCKFKNEIVPTINAYIADERLNWEWRNRPASKAPRLEVVRNPEPPPIFNLTQAQVDKMDDVMIELGIGCGALVRDGDGKARPFIDDADQLREAVA